MTNLADLHPTFKLFFSWHHQRWYKDMNDSIYQMKSSYFEPNRKIGDYIIPGYPSKLEVL